MNLPRWLWGRLRAGLDIETLMLLRRRRFSRLWSLLAAVATVVLLELATSVVQGPAKPARTVLNLGLPMTTSKVQAATVYKENRNLFSVSRRLSSSSSKQPATRISIPATHVDSPVIRTLDTNGVWQTADWAVGYLQGSADPGSCSLFHGRKDCATDLAAHDDIKGEIFKNNGLLHKSDNIYVYTKQRVFTYVVTSKRVVDPSQGSILFSSKKEIVLVSCAPYWVDTNRLVVIAGLRHVHMRQHLKSPSFAGSY